MASFSLGLCRICLQDGATLPIFEKSEGGENVFGKLSQCLQCEKIEDIEGYPRHICTTCNNTLDILCNFISKYKESTKLLSDGLKIVKKEVICIDDSDTNAYSEGEIDINNVKVETKYHVEFEDVEDEKPLNLLKAIKKEPQRKRPKINKLRKQTGLKTSKIASSILEGDFLWTGDQWCVNIGQSTLRRVTQNRPKDQKPRPQTKIKLPKQQKEPEKKLCDICGAVFKDVDKLNTHKRNVHFKKPVKCTECSRICASEYYLKRHVLRRHSNLSKDFICATCGIGFAFKGELTSHIRNVHNKHLKPKKIFACKFCDKTYKCQKSINIHERSVHTGQRPAECSVCGSRFFHEDYLKEHMRLHTGETPFKCPICGRGYAQRGNMKSHLRIHRISELDAVMLSKIKPNYIKLLKV